MELELPPRQGWKYKSRESAAFKLWGELRNGQKFTFYSPDWKAKTYDPGTGLRWLQTVIAMNTAIIKIAVIYDKRGRSDREFFRWAEGAMKYENSQS